MDRPDATSSQPGSAAGTDLFARFQQDGYVVLERFFSEALMRELDALIEAHYGAAAELTHTDEFVDRSQVEVVPWFPHLEGVAAFDQVETHPDLAAVTDAVLGAGWRSDYCMVMFSNAGSAGQAWHQDCPPEHPSQFNLNRLTYTRDVDPGERWAAGGRSGLASRRRTARR